MKSLKKRYAVFIPCYNASATIKETIQSVFEAIQFLASPTPVYIYDDCSTDGSYAVVESYIKDLKDFHLLKNEKNSGERKTTNNAFRSFYDQYDWVCIIHADDIVKKDWLTTLIGEIEKVNDDNCFTVWSSFDTLMDTTNQTEPGDNSGSVQHVNKDIKYARWALRRVSSSWHISGSAINVKLFKLLGGFNENMPQLGDTDFVVRGVLANYSDVYVSRTLTLYRVSEGSVTSTSYRTNRDVKEIYMLLENYKGILETDDKLIMYRTIVMMTGRRMIKWVLKREMKLAYLNFNHWRKSLIQYIMLKFKSNRT